MKLRAFLDVVDRRVWSIVAGAVVVGAVALLASLLLPRSYFAESRILVSGSDFGTSTLGRDTALRSPTPERDTATEAELVRSRPVARAAIAAANLGISESDLLKAIDVSVVGQTNSLAVRAEASTSDRAAQIANAVSRAYIDMSARQKRESVGHTIEQVEGLMREVDASVQALLVKKPDNLSASQKARLDESTSRYSVLALQRDQLRLSQDSAAGSALLISEALPDPEDFSPQPLRAGMLGLLVGLLVSATVVFIRSLAAGAEGAQSVGHHRSGSKD